MERKQQGFSLIELLIVVVIVGVLASVAIPNLLAARRSANEGSAVTALRTLHNAQMTYVGSTGAGSFAGTPNTQGISGLTALAAVGLIDPVFATGAKSGYLFEGRYDTATATSQATFYFSAIPSVSTTTSAISGTGSRRFAIGAPGVIVGDSTTTHFASHAEVLAGSPIGK